MSRRDLFLYVRVAAAVLHRLIALTWRGFRGHWHEQRAEHEKHKCYNDSQSYLHRMRRTHTHTEAITEYTFSDDCSPLSPFSVSVSVSVSLSLSPPLPLSLFFPSLL